MSTSAEIDNRAVPLKTSYVLYDDDVETIEADERETIDKIIQAMEKGGRLTREKYGKSVRTSHAKAHGLLRGEMQVLKVCPIICARDCSPRRRATA